MGWAKFDDRYDDNPKVKRAWRANPAAIGLHVMAVTYCCRHETDGVVDQAWVEEKMPASRQRAKALDTLIECGLLEPHPAGFQVHDFLEFNPSRDELGERRGWRKELHRDRDLVSEIRARDGDLCRYCGETVNWSDRKSAKGGTYDRILPSGSTTLENVVVACHGCSAKKGARTPDEALMPLRDLTQNQTHDLTPDLDQEQIDLASRAGARRDGTGRDGGKSDARTPARRVDPNSLPPDFPDQLAATVGHALEVLVRVHAERGGDVPTVRGVALAIQQFPDRDHLAVARDLEAWSTVGKGAAIPTADWPARYRNFLSRAAAGAPSRPAAAATGGSIVARLNGAEEAA